MFVRNWNIRRRIRIFIFSSHFVLALRPQLFERFVGKIGLWYFDAKVGSGFGRSETIATTHRWVNLRFIFTDFTAENMANSLVFVRVFQPCQRPWFDHWIIFVPETVPQRYSNDLPMDSQVNWYKWFIFVVFPNGVCKNIRLRIVLSKKLLKSFWTRKFKSTKV